MSDRIEIRDRQKLAERLQARLDGALSPLEAAALEQTLAEDPAAAAQAAAFDALARLSERARVAAPSGFTDRVMRAVQLERATVAAAGDESRPFWTRLFGDLAAPWLKPGLAGAALLAALALAAAFLMARLQTPHSSPGRAGSEAPEVAAGGSSGAGETTTLVTHRFVLEAPSAQKVCLVGDFNAWKLCEVPMQKVDGGQWAVELKLPPGRHQYMFVVDDARWQTDPGADVKVDDGFGHQNAVVFL